MKAHTQYSWLIPLACLISGGALLGLSTNIAKYAAHHGLTPLAFLFWAILGAAIALSLIGWWRGEYPPLTKRSVEYYFFAAFVSVAGSNLLLFSAIPHVGAGFVALMLTLPPLLTYLGALLLGMERFQWLRALGVVAALLGAGGGGQHAKCLLLMPVFSGLLLPCSALFYWRLAIFALATRCVTQCVSTRDVNRCRDLARHHGVIAAFLTGSACE
ncbi:EamA family transporter [Spirabiliibacterium falconis]|uniref:EamA family transporter n=1 Tax=Spirabiliibacterium falconis TaxID=572023 RepID=UPI001AADD83A|nr:EamA family transporter [Spirabiliibacterium falconis]